MMWAISQLEASLQCGRDPRVVCWPLVFYFQPITQEVCAEHTAAVIYY